MQDKPVEQHKSEFLQAMLNGAKHYAQKEGMPYEPEKDIAVVSIFSSTSSNMASQIKDIYNLVTQSLLPISQKDIYGVTQGVPQNAVGTVVFPVSAESVFINAETILQTSDGLPYKTVENVNTIIEEVQILNISADGDGICTVTTLNGVPHYLVKDFTISIQDSSDIDFDVVDVPVLEVINETQFTYAKDGLPQGVATGGVIQMSVIALEIQGAISNLGELGAVDGTQTNQEPYTPISFQKPIDDVSENGFVWIGGLSGGQDFESDESISQRIQEIASGGTFITGTPSWYENLVNQIPLVLESSAFEEEMEVDQVLQKVVKIVFLKRDGTDVTEQDIENVRNLVPQFIGVAAIVFTGAVKLFYTITTNLTAAGYNNQSIINIITTAIKSVFNDASLGVILYKASIVNAIYTALKLQRPDISNSGLNSIINNITVMRFVDGVPVENPPEPSQPLECISVIEDEEIKFN